MDTAETESRNKEEGTDDQEEIEENLDGTEFLRKSALKQFAKIEGKRGEKKITQQHISIEMTDIQRKHK